MPYFGIITITRNDSEGFERTRQSLREQLSTCNDFIWVIVDGSDNRINLTDDDPKHIYIFEKDHRSSYPLLKGHSGLFQAMNIGLGRLLDLSSSSVKYINFMNGGDIFAESDILSRVKESTEEGFPLFAWGDHYKFNGTSGPEDAFFKAAAPWSNAPWHYPNHQAMFYQACEMANLRYQTQPAHNHSADYLFTLEFLKKARDASPCAPIMQHLGFAVSRFDTNGISSTNTATLSAQMHRNYYGVTWPNL